MQRTFAAAMLAATLGMGGGAFAADVYSSGGMKDAPFAIPETSWTGFYVGLGLGGAAVDHDVTTSFAEINGVGGTGIFGTVEVGYDRQFGRVVGGIFFNYDFANLSSDFNIVGINGSARLNDMWSVGGRIGYLLNPETLAYFLAAYTQANFDLSAPIPLRGGNPDGYSLGGGLETKLGGNWSLKGEYRFTVLNTDTLSSSCPRVTDQADIQTGRLVLSYKADIFGRDYTPLK